jgi:NADH:ubiquinone oxidoreductase subunit 5 (subunit L)/multisubunit Na+/H+ antiporter MnhA subunit
VHTTASSFVREGPSRHKVKVTNFHWVGEHGNESHAVIMDDQISVLLLCSIILVMVLVQIYKNRDKNYKTDGVNENIFYYLGRGFSLVFTNEYSQP